MEGEAVGAPYVLNAKLPPPDPYESLGMQPVGETRLSLPTVVFALGTPSAQADRASDAVLDMRPGLLIVVDSNSD
jgi:hypothetical protein